MRQVRNIYFFIAFCILVGIVLNTLSYLEPNFKKGFLIGKSDFFEFYKFPLFIHLFSASICLIVGAYQFIYITSKYHPLLGKIYVFSILGFAAPTGIYMSCYAFGGLISQLSFFSLSLLWWIYTLLGYKAALNHKTNQHRRFITVSFILANSAILLRLLLYINSYILDTTPQKTYIISSLLSWVPSLLIIEYYFYKKYKPKSTS